MRRHSGLIFWVLAIIFPIAAIGRFSLLFQESFNKIFNPIWMHILMHGVLFAGLSALLMLTFRLSLSARTMAITLCVVFGVGLLQEGFQAFNLGYFSLDGSISDVAVDFAGGLLGLVLMGWKSRNPMRTVRLDN